MSVRGLLLVAAALLGLSSGPVSAQTSVEIRATAALKTDPETRDIPVIMLTAHSYGSVGRRAREAGCACFISKPCDPKRVLFEVESLIGGTALH